MPRPASPGDRTSTAGRLCAGRTAGWSRCRIARKSTTVYSTRARFQASRGKPDRTGRPLFRPALPLLPLLPAFWSDSTLFSACFWASRGFRRLPRRFRCTFAHFWTTFAPFYALLLTFAHFCGYSGLPGLLLGFPGLEGGVKDDSGQKARKDAKRHFCHFCHF